MNSKAKGFPSNYLITPEQVVTCCSSVIQRFRSSSLRHRNKTTSTKRVGIMEKNNDVLVARLIIASKDYCRTYVVKSDESRTKFYALVGKVRTLNSVNEIDITNWLSFEMRSNPDFYSLYVKDFDIAKKLYESDASSKTTVISTLFGPTLFISGDFTRHEISKLIDDLNYDYNNKCEDRTPSLLN